LEKITELRFFGVKILWSARKKTFNYDFKLDKSKNLGIFYTFLRKGQG